jgi:hypothetical protein
MKKKIREAIEKATVVCEVAEKIEDMELDGRSEETIGMLMWFAGYIDKALLEYKTWGESESDEEEEERIEYLGVLGRLLITVMNIRFRGIVLDE